MSLSFDKKLNELAHAGACLEVGPDGPARAVEFVTAGVVDRLHARLGTRRAQRDGSSRPLSAIDPNAAPVLRRRCPALPRLLRSRDPAAGRRLAGRPASARP